MHIKGMIAMSPDFASLHTQKNMKINNLICLLFVTRSNILMFVYIGGFFFPPAKPVSPDPSLTF